MGGWGWAGWEEWASGLREDERKRHGDEGQQMYTRGLADDRGQVTQCADLWVMHGRARHVIGRELPKRVRRTYSESF